MKHSAAVIGVLVGTGVGFAQVMMPVPPAAERAPAWQPPPEAPKPAPVPPEPDVATPNIVKMEGDRLVWPAKPPEVVALEAIPMDEAQKASWGEKWRSRQAALDETIVKNLDEALAMRAQVMAAGIATDWNALINLAGPINKSLTVSPSLEQFVRTSQVLRPKQLAAFNEAVRHFRAESTADINRRAGTDTTKVMLEKSRDAVRERSQEGLAALDRMAADLADGWAKTKSGLGLSGDFAAGEAALANAKDPATKASAGIELLKAVPADKRAEVLGTFRTPAPLPPKPPGDPATQGVDMPKISPVTPAAK